MSIKAAEIAGGVGASLGGAGKQTKPKMELGRERKKEMMKAKLAAKLSKQEVAQRKEDEAEAKIESRRSCLTCLTCSKQYQNQRRSGELHCKVCKSKGGIVTKAMKEAASLSEEFDSLTGSTVEIRCEGDFPVPQDDWYFMFRKLPFCMLYNKNWRSKISFLQSAGYSRACKPIPKLGWATKENCRRPVKHHPADVKAELRWCLNASPRLNNYEIHKHLKEKFQIGTKVLRVNQIAGWITSEFKRRKEAALKAVVAAGNHLEQAVSSEGVIDRTKLDAEEQNVGDVFDSCIAEFDFGTAVKMGMNPGFDLIKWKHNWRCELFPQRREQRQAFEQEARDEALRKEQGARDKALRKRQAWSNCCGSAVPATSLDKHNNCKDQSRGSECFKRNAKRGKWKRKPAAR